MSPRAASITDTLYRQARRVRLPFRWKKRRYGLRPTKYGIIFLMMLIALLIGSINHNNNFGYLLTFLLGGIVLVSLGYSFRNLQDISITPVPAQPVFAGDTANMSVLLHAKDSVKSGISVRLDHISCEPEDLAGSSSTPISVGVPTSERGILRRHSVSLETVFPLGLIEIHTSLPVSLSCLVYPAPVTGPCITETFGGTEGDTPVANLAGQTDFSELSPYRFGDDLRRVHWKSLAAGKDLHTITYKESYTGGTMFSLSSLPGDDVDLKLGRICHMILTAESRGMNYGLILDDTTITQSRGHAHRSVCLKALALY